MIKYLLKLPKEQLETGNLIEDGINFIKVESIDDLNFIEDKFKYISEATHKNLKRSQLQENDILFSIAGALGRYINSFKGNLPS